MSVSQQDGLPLQLTCNSSETLYSTLSPRTSVHVHTAKTRAKDDGSRSGTFQYVMTRHVPRFLPPSNRLCLSKAKAVIVRSPMLAAGSELSVSKVEAALASATSPALARASIASARNSSASLRSHFNCTRAR